MQIKTKFQLLELLAFLEVYVLISLALASQSLGKTLKIAVIDTGIDSSVPNLCGLDHKTFAEPNPLNDSHGHGTHIAGLINKFAGKGDYCLIAIKYYDVNAKGAVNLRNMIDAIDYAVNLNVDLINISGGGPERSGGEQEVITKALNKGIKVITAAGNNNQNLSKECAYFPACYDKRIVVVGNLSDNAPKDLKTALGFPHNRAPSSNYGSIVNRWEMGTDVESYCAKGKYGCKLTGTSQATAIASGKIVKEMLHK